MSYRFVPQRGFTLVELLIAVAILGMLAILTAQQFAEDRDVLRDRTLAANLDVIQTAIERYHTDTGQYPLFLLGGDVAGWRRWHAAYDETMTYAFTAQNAELHDPLIEAGYLTSYPENPFVDDGGAAMRRQTGGTDSTIGDPRFGLMGNLAGNGLDDPRVFCRLDVYSELEFETRRTQIASVDELDQIEPYAMGGRRGPFDPKRPTRYTMVRTWWPGSFMYRGVQEFRYSRKGWTVVYMPGALRNADTVGYLLGMYGGLNSRGRDLLRLESLDPTGQAIHYAMPPPWNQGLSGALYGLLRESDFRLGMGYPEAMGGGTAWEGPYFPYDRNPDTNYRALFGSPDGIPDGLVHVVTSPKTITY